MNAALRAPRVTIEAKTWTFKRVYRIPSVRASLRTRIQVQDTAKHCMHTLCWGRQSLLRRGRGWKGAKSGP